MKLQSLVSSVRIQSVPEFTETLILSESLLEWLEA